MNTVIEDNNDIITINFIIIVVIMVVIIVIAIIIISLHLPYSPIMPYLDYYTCI